MIPDPAVSRARRFVEQVVMVTGAGGGIGSAICERFAKEGASVYACDVVAPSAEAVVTQLRRKGASVEPTVFDVTDPEACSAAVQEVADRHGRLDVLVNNGGVNRRGDLLTLDRADWDLSFAVNVDALFHLCRAALPIMINAGGGSIVNTASQWGLHPAPGHIAYNVSKAAVVAFSQNLARDYAPYGIRVNAVCPGEIHTPMLETGLARSGRTVADLNHVVPVGRIGQPAEVAALVAFLASDEAPFICGAAVEITGAQAVA